VYRGPSREGVTGAEMNVSESLGPEPHGLAPASKNRPSRVGIEGSDGVEWADEKQA